MHPLSIVTWNLNSIRPRMEHVLGYLNTHRPDILLLQEIKISTNAFPFMEIEERGYNCAVHGQKTYNGVAILSRFPLDDITTILPGDETDEQCRYIEAVVSLDGAAIRVASVYVPNGQEVGSDKFTYKMCFLSRLHAHAAQLLQYREMLVLGGDYNVAPYPDDVYNPAALEGTVCYHPEERKRLRALLWLGLYDAYRTAHPDGHEYSWWDYRGGGFGHNKGLRIDHLLLSPEALDCMQECVIDHEERARDKPSDHAPIRCLLS